ncbi:MAG: hypothetical protein AAB874_06615 [Patescibacteria group bacterium]|mgnify:CR=1 FL=1
MIRKVDDNASFYPIPDRAKRPPDQHILAVIGRTNAIILPYLQENPKAGLEALA